MKKKIDKTYLKDIYKKYSKELLNLTSKIRKDYSKFKKFRATFSDFDGEIMYCLIREIKPKVFYEISPDCGYSSIYITSALTKNKQGKLFSFEIEKKKFSIDTKKFISNNIKNYRYSNHEIVIGDATKTTMHYPDPDMVLIDSCHDSWFAKWYIKHLFPRIRRLAIIQDIVFHDRIEYSDESKELMKFLEKRKYISLGVLERLESFKIINNLFPIRRSFESNTILYSNKYDLQNIQPIIDDPLENNFFDLNIKKNRIYQIENRVEENPKRQNIHRTFLRLSKVTKNDYYLKKAIAFSIDQEHFSDKAYNETLVFLFRNLKII